MKGVSLFSSAGIGETFLSDLGIEISVANELLPKRAELYRKIYHNTNMICGDITNKNIFNEILESAQNTEFLIASPPCQGFSIAGKNRTNDQFLMDERNFLITYVIEYIHKISPKYIIIENVPTLLTFKFIYHSVYSDILSILNSEFSDDYDIEAKVLNTADYGIPQTRLRAIIKMNKKGRSWGWPEINAKKITVRDAIEYLPSLEAGESSNIPWHFARKHTNQQIEWMKHTPTGKSAFSNDIYYPQKSDGTRIKGYESSYRRIKWDEPAPTITIRNDAISSQRNVHPGRLLADGTYSDARVLTPLELMILSSLPINWNIPSDTPEILVRQVIGESIPPLLIKNIASKIS